MKFGDLCYQNPDLLDDQPANQSNGKTMGDLIAKRYSRRAFVQGSLAVAASANFIALSACSQPDNSAAKTAKTERSSNFNFTEIPHGRDSDQLVAEDHQADILIRWGDPIFADAPEFDPLNQSAAAQEQQFGFNNDFIGYWALPPNQDQEARALLCVNHEYPSTQMMFTGMDGDYRQKITAEHIEIEKAATGCSVVEIEQKQGKWRVNLSSQYNRRISARSTEFRVTGPAAGSDRLKTSADPSGIKVIGTMNNCAGGMTPWGTYLSCEENINYHFYGKLIENHPETNIHRRYSIPGNLFQWGRFDPRFNVELEPNEPNRFGWVVEIDPLDATSTPKKRTALGRFKHEGAKNVIAPDGRLVVYMGDDQRFDYLYKFVSAHRVDLDKPENNRDLLDQGTLYVARFTAEGTLRWLPIVFGEAPLNAANGFYSQADVLIETRRAADLLEATAMDRPEDVVPNSHTGKVYVMLTNNTKRQAEHTDATNPRGPNLFGHIIEITEPNGDFTSTRSSWDLLIKAGDPARPEVEAMWHRDTSAHGWFVSPDNGVIDPSGRLWVSTDQGEKVSLSGTNDGLWALETLGAKRGKGKMFFRCPNGAELCGPCFSNSGDALFVAVQHPGVDDDNPTSTNFDNPSTRWPDFDDLLPPRPSVVVIRRKATGRVG